MILGKNPSPTCHDAEQELHFTEDTIGLTLHVMSLLFLSILFFVYILCIIRVTYNQYPFLSPEWREPVNLTWSHREEGRLLLELWDWNRGLGDDFLGR